jgi:DNA-binding NarL/FixJ family response regulator
VIRVVIADDHAPTRLGVREVLEENGFRVVAEAATAPAAVAAAAEQTPDVCLLDLNMPGGGANATAEITKMLPETAVVILTVSRSDDDLFAALTAGAMGYLLKDTDPDYLPSALRSVLVGEAALPPALAARLVQEFRTRAKSRRLPMVGGKSVELTQKEWQVLDGMRDGLSTREIADQMFVGPPTVRSHVSAILKKLAVPSREAALKLLDDM